MNVKAVAEKAFRRDLTDIAALTDAFEVCRVLEEEDSGLAHGYSRQVRQISAKLAKERASGAFWELNQRALLFDAPVDFDAYCRCLERDRSPEKRFYLPRRRQLLPVARALQQLANHELELLAISLPPGVGKSTLALFFLTWLGGREPEKPILGGSHSNAFLRGVYDECLRILDAGGEYCWGQVFPGVEVVKTNAQDMMIDLSRDKRAGKRFATFEFSSIGSGNAGKVRAANLLYCDDLVDGLESALSRERMDKLWNLYATDLRQRKIGDCRELHIATRWSLHDVIGRLEGLYGESGRARFLTVPALDENDESNFDYGGGLGFTTAFYHEQRRVMDDASWRALYMNQPVEREGQLYSEEELRRFFELPEREPDAILAVCDTKDKGSDYCVMPIAYQYGQDYYIAEIICDNSNPDVVEARLADALLRHHVHLARFESNSAGGKIAQLVQSQVKARGGRTTITTKFSSANKETRIITAAGWAKEHFLFLDDSVYRQNREYARAMQFLCGYTMAGKNKHDDVPDAMAMLVDYADALTGVKTQVFHRPY